MAEIPDVKAGGLPYGAAAELNKGMATAKAAVPEAPVTTAPVEDTSPPEGVDLSGDIQAQGLPAMTNEDQVLVGPSDYPSRPIKSTIPASGKAPLPKDVWQALPAMLDAASMPNASKELIALLRNIQYHISVDNAATK